MESWGYDSQGKGFVFNEYISAPDVIGRGKNGLMGTQNCLVENQGIVELGFPEMLRKFCPGKNLVKDCYSSKVVSEQISTTNVFLGEEEIGFSSSVVESDSRDSSLIDLKLGRIADHGYGAKDFRFSKAESSVSAKRVRVGLSSRVPYCQVYGCKKDLSSCKDYHKRHKVCEVHSKTAKVVVNGIEQRFCQQCSRFHLLAEFDDGKRSCRKRLAGHNERRRKPRVGIHSSRTGMLYQPNHDSRLQGSTLTTSSFICQDILPSNLLHLQTHDTNDWSARIKFEDGACYSSQSAFSPFHRGFEKHCPPMGTEFDEINQYPYEVRGPDSVSCSLVQNTSIGSDNLNLCDSASAVQGLSRLSASGCVLSLLSSQSGNSSSHYGVCQDSGKLLGLSLLNKFSSSGTNYVEENHFGPVVISDGIFHGSKYINGRDGLSCEDGPALDLLQLSPQLQRVEDERQSIRVKQKNNAF